MSWEYQKNVGDDVDLVYSYLEEKFLCLYNTYITGKYSNKE